MIEYKHSVDHTEFTRQKKVWGGGMTSNELHLLLCDKTRKSLHTFNLCSLLFTITAVICWSMNTRMVVNNAGIAAASIVHQGFFPSGGISQPRDSAFVGWKTVGMLSLGVPTLRAASTPTMIITDIITAKSDTTLRTWIKEQHVSVIFVIDHSMQLLPNFTKRFS